MAFGLASFFLNPVGLIAALLLIPFFLLYLIRPKPKHEQLPSLLFMMKDLGRTNVNSFLRTFLKDFLFILHLLILLALIAAIARPYVTVPRSYLVEQTVIVLDASASMSAGNRFNKALDIAKAELGKENTLILVKATPELVVEHASANKVREVLSTLKPSGTTTALTDALQLAAGYASTGTRVVVISDFVPSSGDLDYETAADVLRGTGAIVDYKPVTSTPENVGIIDLLVGPVTSSAWVKNYNDRPVQVTLEISEARQELLLAAGETKEVSFKTPAGVAEVTITNDDALALDNKVWVSTPEKNTITILVISNNRQHFDRSNFKVALDVIQQNFPTTFKVEYAEPPKIPNLDYDVYLFTEASMNFILPGYVKEIGEKVNDGAALIVFTQDALFSLDWQGLLPVSAANDTEGGRSQVLPQNVNLLTKDVEFGQTSSYTRVVAKDSAGVIAETTRDPVIVLAKHGRGHVLYYGIDDTKASFSKDPSYPVFWRRTFDLLTNRPSLENLNVRTGNVLSLNKQSQIRTPSKTLTTSYLMLDEAGLYTLEDRTIAANLLSDAESNLATPDIESSTTDGGPGASDKLPKDLSPTLLWVALALLFIELSYVKYRGDF